MGRRTARRLPCIGTAPSLCRYLETGKDTADTEVDKDKNGFMVPRERPAAVLGITERVRTGHGTMYVTVNFDEDNRPFELFTAIGKAGGSEPAHLEGLSRLVTLCLRSGVDPNAIIYHLSGITSEPVWDNGVLIRSAEDGVAHVLRRHLKGLNSPGTASLESDGFGAAGTIHHTEVFRTQCRVCLRCAAKWRLPEVPGACRASGRLHPLPRMRLYEVRVDR